MDYREDISIHSTARVETLMTEMSDDQLDISIHSTARVETVIDGAVLFDVEFQSTPPRGWRR